MHHHDDTSHPDPATDLGWIVAVAQQQSTDTRRVMTLRYVYGFNQHQICEQLQMSPTTVDAHLVTAVKAVVEAYERRSVNAAHPARDGEVASVFNLRLDWPKTY